MAVTFTHVGESDEEPYLPVMMQWVNKRGDVFSRRDLAISRQLRDVMQRLADARQTDRSITILQERFQLGDARRVALMESARMLAKKSESTPSYPSPPPADWKEHGGS